MNVNTVSLPVSFDDTEASFKAAFARIEEVPVSGTLIDQLPEEDWLSDQAQNWVIEAGSAAAVDEELDNCDAEGYIAA